MELDPRRVLVFREVARAGSLSAAARVLGWTQPAVSQQLAALERAAGQPLVVRGPRGVRLTEAGQALLTRADTVATALHMAGEELASLVGLRRGRVRLAAFPSAAATVVPQVLARLTEDLPGLDLELTEAEPPEAAALVASGDVDLALVFSYASSPVPDEAGLVLRGLGEEPVRLVLPAGHRLAGELTVEVSELAEDPWIVGCPRCREHALAVCREAGFEPRVQHATDDYVVVQNLVAVGVGVTLLPGSALEAFVHPGVTTRDSPAYGVRRHGVLHRTEALDVPATAAVLALLESVAATRR